MVQVLTSETAATGADLLDWLRARWRIENKFKYAAGHNGIDAPACYDMDTAPEDRMGAKPARAAARTHVHAAAGELVAAERALPQLLDDRDNTIEESNAALLAAHQPSRWVVNLPVLWLSIRTPYWFTNSDAQRLGAGDASVLVSPGCVGRSRTCAGAMTRPRSLTAPADGHWRCRSAAR